MQRTHSPAPKIPRDKEEPVRRGLQVDACACCERVAAMSALTSLDGPRVLRDVRAVEQLDGFPVVSSQVLEVALEEE